MPGFREIIGELKKQERVLLAQLDRIRTAISSLEFGSAGAPAPAIIDTPNAAGRRPGKARRRLSAAGRARIAAAQKRRWAKVRAAKNAKNAKK